MFNATGKEIVLKKQTARTAAVEALLQVKENQGYSNIVLDKVLTASGLDIRDRSLASAIFYGTLERQIPLDFILVGCFTDSRRKTDPAVLIVLRSAAYQILYLEKVPDFAAVNEAVDIVRELDKAAYVPFVNAVLRTLIRKKDILLGSLAKKADNWSLQYSVPKELVSLWKRYYGGAHTQQMLQAFTEKPKTYIRVNSLKMSREALLHSMETELAAKPVSWLPQAAEIQGGHITALPQFQEGLLHVQDLSAQLICEILSPKPGERIYDVCAAPGGKSFTIAQMMEDTGEVHAFDLYKGRVGLVQSGTERLGITCVLAKRMDALRGFAQLPQGDRVLCDVPCSGYGVIRRKPEIRYKTLDEVSSLPETQYQILKNAAVLVREGGLLLYSTCTLNPKENEEVARRFLRENKGFLPAPIAVPQELRLRKEDPHMFTMLPQAAQSDGFFAAAFCRKSNRI